ncbi:MAG: hypothetical protein ACT4QA_10665 [Panacagrimonas sp.]
MSESGGAHGRTVYVRRNGTGQIVSISRVPAPDHVERCPVEQADVAVFVQRLVPRNAALLESDLSLIRALEDLIDVLIHKDLLRLTDLPDPVQAKLLARRRLRGSLNSLSLLDDEPDIV